MENENLSEARKLAVKFLYKCEIEKIYFYPQNQLETYGQDFAVDGTCLRQIKMLLQGVFDHLSTIDEQIKTHSKSWGMERMSLIDKSILRLAIHELINTKAPKKVVINEAVNLAKEFGAEQSFKFVNGILDKVAHTRSQNPKKGT